MDGSLGSNDLNETMYSNLSWTNGTMYEDEEPLYDPPVVIHISIYLSIYIPYKHILKHVKDENKQI